MKVHHLWAAVLVTAIFGLNYSAIKLGLASFDPLLLGGMRFALCAFPAMVFVPRPQCRFVYLAVYGVFMATGLWCVLLGMRAGLSAGMTALVLQFGALLTVLVGMVWFKEKISRFNVAGCVLSVAGLGLIATVTDGSVTAAGLAFALAGTASWVVVNTAIKSSRSQQPLRFIVWSAPVSAATMFLIRWAITGANPLAGLLAHLHGEAIAALLFTAYVTTLFAYSVWTLLLSRYQLAISAPTYLLVPIFSMVFSYWIFGETVGWTKVAAAVLILGGVVVNSCGKGIHEAWCAYARISKAQNAAGGRV
jgi:O-acetylserine/cysteine efflux transporter